MEGIKSILYDKDVKLTFFFNMKLKCRLLDRLLPLLTYIGSATITISFCVLLIGIGHGPTRYMGLEALISLAVSTLIVQLLKNSVCRERPKDVIERLNTFNVPIDCYSFPSGHTASVFSIAVILALHMPLFALILFPIALTVAISRIYTGVHYPSDVLAGIAVAVITSYMINIFMNKI